MGSNRFCCLKKAGAYAVVLIVLFLCCLGILAACTQNVEDAQRDRSQEAGSDVVFSKETTQQEPIKGKSGRQIQPSIREEPAVPASGDTKAEVVRLYTQAYNKTKQAGVLKGNASISILQGSLRLNGKVNTAVENLVNRNVNRLLGQNETLELPPAGSGFETCVLRKEDIKIASMQQEKDKIRLKMIPRDMGLPEFGKGGSGNLITGINLAQVKQLAEAQGVTFAGNRTFDQCVTLEYLGGECTVTIEQSTGFFSGAEYKALIYAKAEHVNVAWFQDQAVSATISYTMVYPAKE